MDNTEWIRQQKETSMSKLTTVDAEEWVADQKSIGAMEEALLRISEGRMPKARMIDMARRALACFRRYQRKASTTNESPTMAR